MGKNASKRVFKKRVGCCESCGFKVLFTLHIHHLLPQKLRGKSEAYSQNTIVLCANCHNILHHEVGWNTNFVDVLTKEQSLKIIKDVLA